MPSDLDPSGKSRSPQAASPHPPPSVEATARPGWGEMLKVYLEPATLRMLTLGFSAGLPLLLLLGTLSFRLREAGLNRATIGYLSWVALAYAFKWVWAPLVDRLPLPLLTTLLGRRRSWLLFAQLLVVSGLIGMALCDPRTQLQTLTLFALLTAFGAATQDIALDAFRIESAQITRQAALAAAYQTGYRLAMIWAGAGALWLAAQIGGSGYSASGWTLAYGVMAVSMSVGMVTVLCVPEPQTIALPPARKLNDWLHEALIQPFADFLHRYRTQALLILMLIALYRISDVVMGVMAGPFYVDMHYSKEEVAYVSKIYGVLMTLAGGFIGGMASMRLGVMRVLMLGAVLSALTNLLYVWLWQHGHDVRALTLVVSADNLSGGIASAAFIAYLSSLTNVRYSATQYALFSSMMLLLPKFLAGYSGLFVDLFGYPAFFAGTAALGLPVLVLVGLAARQQRSAMDLSAPGLVGSDS